VFSQQKEQTTKFEQGKSRPPAAADSNGEGSRPNGGWQKNWTRDETASASRPEAATSAKVRTRPRTWVQVDGDDLKDKLKKLQQTLRRVRKDPVGLLLLYVWTSQRGTRCHDERPRCGPVSIRPERCPNDADRLHTIPTYSWTKGTTQYECVLRTKPSLSDLV
jgi:hypothetical protein